jgi:SHOCT-like domain
MTAQESERRLILEMIASGKISASEGLRLLNTLGEVNEPEAGEDDHGVAETVEDAPATTADPVAVSTSVQSPAAEIPEADPPASEAPPATAMPGGEPYSRPQPPDIERWRRWWMVPLWIGVGITVLGALLLFWVIQRAGVGFWFFCSSIPFLTGLVVLVLAYQSRTAHWLHVRIHQRRGDWPQRINLSFPLPIRLTAWFLNRFGDRIPGLQKTSLDEIIQALDRTTTPENPIFVQVDEGEAGERVEIFIG